VRDQSFLTEVFDVVKILNFPSSTGHLLEKTMKSLHFNRFFSIFSPKSPVLAPGGGPQEASLLLRGSSHLL
jgi:hypothetical protein